MSIPSVPEEQQAYVLHKVQEALLEGVKVDLSDKAIVDAVRTVSTPGSWQWHALYSLPLVTVKNLLSARPDITFVGSAAMCIFQEIHHATGEDVEPEVLSEMHEGIVYKYLVNGSWRTSSSGRTIKNLTPYDETVSVCRRHHLQSLLIFSYPITITNNDVHILFPILLSGVL